MTLMYERFIEPKIATMPRDEIAALQEERVLHLVGLPLWRSGSHADASEDRWERNR